MENRQQVINTIAKADLDTQEHDYIVACLKEAVAYCKQQYEDSCIDVLPSISTVNCKLSEADKFEVLSAYLSDLTFD